MAMAFITTNDSSYDVTESNKDCHYNDTSSPTVSGANPADKACNIYDLAGNCYEYIAEKNHISDVSDVPLGNQFIRRGGYYGDFNPASYRGYHSGVARSSHSSRFVLYVI